MAEYKNVIRTKKAIKRAFNELIEEKNDIKKITVKELVDRAEISKSTFYTHYKDLFGVLYEYENEAIQKIVEQIHEYFKGPDHTPNQYVHVLFEAFKKNETLYAKLVRCNADFSFLDKLFDSIYPEIYKYLSQYYTPVGATGLRYEISFTTYGTISMLFNYLIGRLDFTIDEIEAKTIQMFEGITYSIDRLVSEQNKKKK